MSIVKTVKTVKPLSSPHDLYILYRSFNWTPRYCRHYLQLLQIGNPGNIQRELNFWNKERIRKNEKNRKAVLKSIKRNNRKNPLSLTNP